MNIVDYVVLGILAISVLFGMYRGFISALAGMGTCLLSFGGSFILYPRAAELIRGNEELVRTLLHYTDAASRLGDLQLAVMKVINLTTDTINEIVQKANLPEPINTLLTVNLQQQVYNANGSVQVSDYVSQTILNACINVISFVACFLLLFLALTLCMGIIRAIFQLPVLKQLDSLAGGCFGLLRGLLICFVLFTLVPLVLTVVPMDMVSELIEQSVLAPWFTGGASNLILHIMNGKM